VYLGRRKFRAIHSQVALDEHRLRTARGKKARRGDTASAEPHHHHAFARKLHYRILPYRRGAFNLIARYPIRASIARAPMCSTRGIGRASTT
jgi:hypothetical protein